MKHEILCVDDELDNLEALERVFRGRYRVHKASSADEALVILANHQITVIISDHRMPRITGVEFFKKALVIQPDAIRILLTGYSDIDSVIAAINDGQIYRYLTKPWNNDELKATVAQAVERFELKNELKVRNRELQAALDELKLLDQAKSHFMILVNHELKTPLTGILSFLELLMETPLNDEQKKFAQRILTNADRLKKMIYAVLELMSEQTEYTPLNLSSVSTKSAVQKSLEKFRQQASLKNLAFEISDENLQVQADENSLNKVLGHLIDNAIKFSEADSKIKISTKQNSTGKIEFIFENQGKPIDPAILALIKKPFFLNEDIMNHSKGLGLGLSVSEAILKRHQSQLEIQANDNSIQVKFELAP